MRRKRAIEQTMDTTARMIAVIAMLLCGATFTSSAAFGQTRGNAVSAKCKSLLRQCHNTCTRGGRSSEACAKACSQRHHNAAVCRPAKAPPAVRLPSPNEIKKLSPFCRKFLGICVGSCIKSNAKVRDKNGREYPIEVLQLFCRRRCWNLPVRARLCKMKRSQLLANSDKLVQQSVKELKAAEAEDKKEEQRYLKQQAEINKQRAAAKARDAKATQKRKLAEQNRRREAARVKAAKAELAKERNRIAKEQKRLKRQAALRAQAKLKELKAERQRLALQRKQLQEQQSRLKILKQQLQERRNRERKQRELERKRKQEQDKLLKQQQSELAALKQQRIKYKQELSRIQQLTKKRQQMAKEAARLAKERKKAQAAKRRQLQAKIKRLKQRSKQIGKQQRAFAKNTDAFKKRRRTRRKRLAMLRRRVRRTSRRRLRRGNKHRAQRAYCKRKWKRAKRYFKRAKRPDLAQKIDVFLRLFQHGRVAFGQRNVDVAIPDLERAFTLDMELGGGKSPFTKQLRKMLADMYYLKGRLSLSRKYYSSSFIYFSAARRYLFAHKGATQGVLKLRQMAKQLYTRALSYDAGSRYRRRLLRKAVRIIVKTDPLYKRIHSVLDK